MNYDFNHASTYRKNASIAVLEAIDAGLEARNAAQPERTYLGASMVGDACERRIQFDVTRAPGEPFKGKTLRIFQRGHTYEDVVADFLTAGGFTLRRAKEDGNQYGFSVAAGKFGGHIDGIIDDGPAIEGLEYPAIWENKALGAKSFKSLVDKGLAEAKPEYAVQVALYQAYLDYTKPALFTAINGDTMDIYSEVVPFNEELAQFASDKAVRIIQANAAGELLSRAAGDPDSFPCRFCERWRTHCWSDGGLGPNSGR